MVRRRTVGLGSGAPAFKQPRAARTYQALVDAATRVFTRRGFDAAQTPEIAAEAGVSTGAFYRYFTDKRQIFVEVIVHHMTRAHAEVMAALAPERFAGADARGVIDVALEVLFSHFKRHAKLERLFLDLSLRDPEVQRLRAEFDAIASSSLADLVGQMIPRDRVPDPRAAARVIYLAAVEVASDCAGLRPTLEAVDERGMTLALRELIHSYLYGDAVTKPSETSARSTSARGGRKRTGVAPSSRRGG